MKIKVLMERLGLDEKIIKKVCDNLISEDDYLRNKDLIKRNKEEFFVQMDHKPKEERYFFYLLYSLRASLDTYKDYQDRGIKDQIFFDSLSDIRIWVNECRRKYGFIGLEEFEWVIMSLELKVFRLGRLQFEKTSLKEDFGTLKKGSDVISIHIAEDGPLLKEQVIDSIEKSKHFYKKDLPYICMSWLLDPDLYYYLDKDSNILAFLQMFDVVRVDKDNHQAEVRVFKDLREDKENYPEATRLQKRYKKALMKGKKLGVGYGILKDIVN